MNRRQFLTALSSGLVASAVAFRCTQNQPLPKPNILVILVDDLGYGDLSSYGAGDLRTPHIDRLISQGMRFDHFYANCPVCSPTRASVLTGRYPDLVGVPGVIRDIPDNSWGHLTPDAKLAPEILNKAGYTSAIIGKWHLGLSSPNIPNDRGFDYFKGFLGDMMDDYWTHRRHGHNFMRLNKQEIDPEGHATDLFTDWARQYLQDQQNNDQPFFLYLAYNAPHFPVQPPKEWLDRYKAWEKTANPTRAALCAFIEHLDDGIGQVMSMLKQTGLDENTLVIFTSDNGGLLRDCAHNGPYRSGKQVLFEGGIRVPMAARWPGRIPANSQSNRIALTMDILPTLTEAAGVSIEHEIDGKSFLPTLLGEQQPPEKRDLFFGRMEGGIWGIRKPEGVTIHAIRRGDWKLLEPIPDAPLELYNLKTDPMERQNLADKEPEKFNELKIALDAQLERYEQVPWKPPERR